MNSDDVLAAIVEGTRTISASVPDVDWYGFGSYFRGDPCFQDIDILAVCLTSDDGVLVRSLAKELCSYWPIHLTIMTVGEEAETAFIVSQNCQRI